MAHSISKYSSFDLPLENGYGEPSHIAKMGTFYFDNLTSKQYQNKNGLAEWVEFTNSSTSSNTPFTGGTVSGATIFTNGLTSNTISATTYYNLPTDVYTTGGTYTTGITTFINNTGGTFTVTGFSTPFTGGTVTGATNFTDGLSANTFSATTIMGIEVSGGSLSLNAPAISGRETIITAGVADNSVDKFIIANGTTTAGRFIPTFVGYTLGAYQSLLFRGLGDSASDLSSTVPYVQFLAANTDNSTDPNNGTLLAPVARDLYTFSTQGATYLTIKAGGRILIGTTVDDGINQLQVNGDTSIIGTLTATTISATTYQNLPPDINNIIITTAISITTNTTDTSGYGQNGRNVMISNGANAINLTCETGSTANFVASYTKLGSSTITFVAGSGSTLVQVDGTAALSGIVGSTACLTRTNNTYYLQISNR